MTEWIPKILVVDDEPANIQLLERLLERAGYPDVTSTTVPEEVPVLFEKAPPDLIMLDLHMPGLDGHAVMERLAKVVSADDYLPILVLTGDVTLETKRRALSGGAKDFLTKPFDPTEALARIANLLEARFLHLQLRAHNELLEEKVKERTAELWTTINHLERAQKDLRLAQEETITSLSLAAEFRDDETSRHIERMSRYCWVIAEGTALDTERRETLRVAAKMHDVGKIGIPDAILRKPGRLTTAEFEIMKAHAQIGYEILSGSASDLAATAASIAWTHHEKVDGSGYPRGLAGEEIPLEARIAAVADVFDALITNRVYRKAFTFPDAVKIMQEGRGVHFDTEVLDAFFERIDEILRIKQDLDEV